MSYRMIHEPANVPKPKAEHDVRRVDQIARELCVASGGKWGKGTHRAHWIDKAQKQLSRGCLSEISAARIFGRGAK